MIMPFKKTLTTRPNENLSFYLGFTLRYGRIKTQSICCAILLSILALLLACCEQHKWEGFVYPKTGQMPYDLAIGHFATLEECRASSLVVLSKTHPEKGAKPEYECGFKCTVSTTPPVSGMLASRVCEDISK